MTENRRVQDMTDDELLAHVGLPPAVLGITRARNENAVRSIRARAGEAEPAGRQPARRATPEQMDAQRRRNLSALHPRDPRNVTVSESDLTDGWTDEHESMRSRIFDGQPEHNTPEIDPSAEADRRERWSVRGMSKQFDGVGQPVRPEHGEFFTEHRDGYGNETMSFGWGKRGADPKKVPFSQHIYPEDYESGSAAYVHMTRTLDQHYAMGDADAHYNYEEREDGHHQGVLLDSTKAKPWKVHEMYATKDGRHMSNVLLGLAAEHSMRTSGRLPTASNDLSQHSTRVVHKLADSGIIEAPKNEHRNNLNWETGHNSALSNVAFMARAADNDYEGSKRISNEEGMHGGRVMRQIIRGARPAGPEKWTPETLSADSRPPVNARSDAGRFQEFKHHQDLQQKYDKPKEAPAPQQSTLF